MKMVKVILGTLLIFCIALAGGVWGYVQFILPEKVELKGTNNDAYERNINKIPFIPEVVKDRLKTGKKAVDPEMKVVDDELKRLDVTYDDLELVIRDIDTDEVIKTVEVLNNSEFTSTDQVFDIVRENIKVDHLDVEIFRETFRNYITMDMVNVALRHVEENDALANLTIPVAKETVLKIIRERKQDVERELERINR